MILDSKTMRLLLVYECDGPLCREVYSDDEGKTWSTPATMAIPGDPKHPDIIELDAGILRPAVVLGSPNVIKATWQSNGSQTQSAPFTFVDDNGDPLEVADSQFHVTPWGDVADRCLLEVNIAGESSSSSWWSSDNGKTWTRFL